MAHLGPENIARKFKGMVERCADCGFDLAGGRVEVVPTAHYMMGGVEFEPDCGTGLPGLFAAGEDCGGVHGANRLGGNGVANSTVFGGIAGESMAAYVQTARAAWREADKTVLEAGISRAEHPFRARGGDLSDLRERLSRCMWDDVGILRTRDGLRSALTALGDFRAELHETGLADGDRAFNMTWHDWMNLESQIDTSAVIASAALGREDSRGAHFREDFPETGSLEETCFTRITQTEAGLALEMVPVEFSIVAPGQSLIEDEAGAPPSAAE